MHPDVGASGLRRRGLRGTTAVNTGVGARTAGGEDGEVVDIRRASVDELDAVVGRCAREELDKGRTATGKHGVADLDLFVVGLRVEARAERGGQVAAGNDVDAGGAGLGIDGLMASVPTGALQVPWERFGPTQV